MSLSVCADRQACESAWYSIMSFSRSRHNLHYHFDDESSEVSLDVLTNL